jgi:hypothetical protein
MPQQVLLFTWSAFAPGTNQAPDVDLEFAIGDKDFSLLASTLDAANVSDDVDVFVQVSNVEEGAKEWTTRSYAGLNLTDNESADKIVTKGPKLARLRANNNHATDNAAPTAIVRLGQ